MKKYTDHIVLPASGELGRSGYLRLSGYQHLVCAAAECEMINCHCSVKETVSKGYAWAFTSLTIDVLHPINGCDALTANTWISIDRFPINRRELQFSANGTEYFRAAVFSTPVSTESHGIIRPTEDLSCFATGDTILENVVSRITSLPEMSEVYRREVFPSDIDALGHMNNCRYGALAYDALTEDERMNLTRPFRYTVNFRRQFFEGSTVIVCRGEDERGVFITGSVPDSEKPNFIVWLEFKNDK